MTGSQAFDDMYWNAQPLPVRALRNMDTGSADRGTLAATLAAQGYTIDVPIMVLNWDALTVMTIRQADGMTWVPSALQPNIGYLVQGELPNPPFLPYDPSTRPPGSIKVSTDPSDYPAFDPPKPPAPATSNIVGSVIYGNIYGSGPGAMKDSRTPAVTDGEQISQNGSTFTAHVGYGLMGPSVYFSKN